MAIGVPGGNPDDWNPSRPLSDSQSQFLLKQYARQAGLETSKVTWNAVRNTAALLRLETGDNLEEIRRFLGSASHGGVWHLLRGLSEKAARPGQDQDASSESLERKPRRGPTGSLVSFKHGLYSTLRPRHPESWQGSLESYSMRLAAIAEKIEAAESDWERLDWIVLLGQTAYDMMTIMIEIKDGRMVDREQ